MIARRRSHPRWVVCNTVEYLGSFDTKREAIEYFAGRTSRRYEGFYEIVGPRGLTGRWLFRCDADDTIRAQRFDWAVKEARLNGDI